MPGGLSGTCDAAACRAPAPVGQSRLRLCPTQDNCQKAQNPMPRKEKPPPSPLTKINTAATVQTT
jgi:hypothetical protein